MQARFRILELDCRLGDGGLGNSVVLFFDRRDLQSGFNNHRQYNRQDAKRPR